MVERDLVLIAHCLVENRRSLDANPAVRGSTHRCKDSGVHLRNESGGSHSHVCATRYNRKHSADVRVGISSTGSDVVRSSPRQGERPADLVAVPRNAHKGIRPHARLVAVCRTRVLVLQSEGGSAVFVADEDVRNVPSGARSHGHLRDVTGATFESDRPSVASSPTTVLCRGGESRPRDFKSSPDTVGGSGFQLAFQNLLHAEPINPRRLDVPRQTSR